MKKAVKYKRREETNFKYIGSVFPYYLQVLFVVFAEWH